MCKNRDSFTYTKNLHQQKLYYGFTLKSVTLTLHSFAPFVSKSKLRLEPNQNKNSMLKYARAHINGKRKQTEHDHEIKEHMRACKYRISRASVLRC